MQKIYLIRHGETEWNKELRYQGQRDIPLNAQGRRQAMQLAARLATEKFQDIYSSPLLRARETAAQIASRHGKQVHLEKGLSEIDFGEWEGRRYTELEEEQKRVAECWFSKPGSVCIPGGEPYGDFKKRTLEAFQRILNGNNRDLAIVSHAGIIRIIVAAMLEMPEDSLIRLRLSPASLTILIYDDWRNPYLDLLNATCHLKDR